jgi:prepilin-type N-terminal cleavage/methylation domain-containing protein
MKKIIKKNWAFTLIELLVTISVIGVLTTILMINFVGSRERAKNSQKVQNLKVMKNALRLYYNDYQTYPEDGEIEGSIDPAYIPTSIYSEIGAWTYSQLDGGDAFIVRVILDNGVGVDWEASQSNCGVSVGDNVYVVCSN